VIAAWETLRLCTAAEIDPVSATALKYCIARKDIDISAYAPGHRPEDRPQMAFRDRLLSIHIVFSDRYYRSIDITKVHCRPLALKHQERREKAGWFLGTRAM
jgi:hypothetical protein